MVGKRGSSIPLHLAASEGDVELVKELLEQGLNVNARDMHGLTPLHVAALKGHTEVAKVLLEHGADVNAREECFENTPLHLTLEKGHLEVVKVLLEHGADINAENSFGETPKDIASGRSKDIEQFLKWNKWK